MYGREYVSSFILEAVKITMSRSPHLITPVSKPPVQFVFDEVEIHHDCYIDRNSDTSKMVGISSQAFSVRMLCSLTNILGLNIFYFITH